LKHWLHGGATDLGNLVLLCHRHHRMVHEGGWQLVRDDEGRILTIPSVVITDRWSSPGHASLVRGSAGEALPSDRRALLASLWPDIADVGTIRVHGTQAQGHLLAGWLRSGLGRDDIVLEVDESERLDGIDLDGKPASFPPGDPPSPSDVLSDELDRFTRDRVYEAAVRAIA